MESPKWLFSALIAVVIGWSSILIELGWVDFSSINFYDDKIPVISKFLQISLLLVGIFAAGFAVWLSFTHARRKKGGQNER